MLVCHYLIISFTLFSKQILLSQWLGDEAREGGSFFNWFSIESFFISSIVRTFKNEILLTKFLQRRELLQFSWQYFSLSYPLYSGAQYLKQYSWWIVQAKWISEVKPQFTQWLLCWNSFDERFHGRKYQNLERGLGHHPNLSNFKIIMIKINPCNSCLDEFLYWKMSVLAGWYKTFLWTS